MSGPQTEDDEKQAPNRVSADETTTLNRPKKAAFVVPSLDDEEPDGDHGSTLDEGEDDEATEAVANEADAEGETDDEPVRKKESKREKRRREAEAKANEVPKDRNARLRQQLLKKRQEAEQAAAPLTAGEIVDDAFARGLHSAGKWARRNSDVLQYVAAAVLLGAIGYGGWSYYRTGQIETASNALGTALHDEHGRVIEGGAPKDDEDPTPTFATKSAKLDASLAAYRRAVTLNPGSGAAILARLGEAGMLLDKQSWDEALAGYREVKTSPLATADADVKARAIEGIGFALEGKGDRDAAQKAFKELETIPNKGFKQLGMYHQARLLLAKGDKDAALELIKAARSDLKTSGNPSINYLSGVLDDLHRVADPASAPTKAPMGGGNRQLSMEEFQRLQQQFQEQMRKASSKQGGHDEHGDEGDHDEPGGNEIPAPTPAPRKP